MTKKVILISNWIDDNLFIIEFILTLIIFSLFATIGRIIKNYHQGSMSIAAGMFFYSSNLNERQVKKSERFIRSECIKCAHIHILGASGWHTFGSLHSPLHEGLQKCNEAEIILIYPLSDNLVKRAQDVNQNPDEYRKEIYNSLEFLKELRNSGDNPERIKVKMYQGYPGWKYIFLGRYVWVQKYPNNTHVRNSPCYAFQRTADKFCIYGQFFEQFKRRWESHHLGIYNFDTDMLEFYNSNNEKTRIMPIRKGITS